MADVLIGTLVRLSFALPFIAIGLAVEALRQRQPASTVRVNLLSTVVYYVAEASVGVALVTITVSTVAALPGAGLLKLDPAPDAGVLELIGFAMVWLLVADFFYYWLHRTEHAVGWLWAIHEVHHADEHVNVTSAHRHHWLETALQAICILTPLAYVLAPTPNLALTVALLAQAYIHFIHTDIRVSLGRWNWLIATPQSHRLHHSTAQAHFDKNFAAMFPIWDVMFRTYHPPPDGPITTGVSGVHMSTIGESTWHPFRRWWRVLKARHWPVG